MNKLFKFLSSVEKHIDNAVSNSTFHSTQKDLLEQTVNRFRNLERRNPLGGPLSMFYLVASAWGRELDEEVERMAAFCNLYILAADLLDDVQDDDLEGKPHEKAGPAIASNNAVTLLFLAMGEFHKAIELETDSQKRTAFLEVFNRLSIRVVAGQHRDLLGYKGSVTPEEVLSMNQAKTSSLTLLTECAAILSGCDQEAIGHYRKAGEQMALLVQVRDDLRDIFGKNMSPDLKTAKMTYPVSCYLSSATQGEIKKFESLVSKLPESMSELRELLYQSGAVKQCAEALENSRIDIHQSIASIKRYAPEHRMILDMADAVSGSVYVPPALKSTSHYWTPEGVFHEKVRKEFHDFTQRMQEFGFPESPLLKPWHYPQWMYDADKKVIYYPDIEGQGEEILPFQTALLGTSSLDQAAEIMFEQVPVVLAHELFHFWRDASGRLTDDHWHEEWAANRLVVTYLRSYAPKALEKSLGLANEVLGRFPDAMNDHTKSIIDRCEKMTPDTKGYELDMAGTAIVEIELFRRLAKENESFKEAMNDLLVSGKNKELRQA